MKHVVWLKSFELRV